MYFGASYHQVSGNAEDNVVGVFIFMQFMIPHFPDSSRIWSAMSANQVEASSFQFVRFNVVGS